MNIHPDLITLGFIVVEINKFNKEGGFLVYERETETEKLFLVFYNSGEITLNKFKIFESEVSNFRELIFKVQYTSDEFLILQYLKHYLEI